MIKHYVVLAATFSDDDEEMTLEIDHAFLLNHLGGVALDTETGTFLSPTQLEEDDDKAERRDGLFVSFVGTSVFNAGLANAST